MIGWEPPGFHGDSEVNKTIVTAPLPINFLERFIFITVIVNSILVIITLISLVMIKTFLSENSGDAINR